VRAPVSLTLAIIIKGGNTFRILVVDDDPAGAHLLRELTKNLQRRHELHFVWDGVQALDFLNRRGGYANAERPHLVLLDVNLPRLGGLETLAAIKSDPELCTIPVIMLSTSNSPQDVRKSYQARANCYVQKPANLERSVKLVEAIEAFWMDFVLAPEGNPAIFEEIRSGPPIASQSAEATSRARSMERPGCEEHDRLLDECGMAVREVIELHEQQFLAIIEGDSECHRFDLLIHMANEKKQLTKYAYLRHVEAHGCSNTNAVKQTRT